MLLRHASAEIDGFNQEEDHEKPLDNKGKIECMNLSDWLKKSVLDFDLVITSDAIRALQTTSLVFDPLKVSIKKNSLFFNFPKNFSCAFAHVDLFIPSYTFKQKYINSYHIP